jgi:hypothetical protein
VAAADAISGLDDRDRAQLTNIGVHCLPVEEVVVALRAL